VDAKYALPVSVRRSGVYDFEEVDAVERRARLAQLGAAPVFATQIDDAGGQGVSFTNVATRCSCVRRRT
jgi:hypothetical protein